MAETVEELSYDYQEEGKLVRRELKKEVLTKGAWATVMFMYQELDRKAEEEIWNAPRVSIVRFKKFNGSYRKQSSFNFTSEKQARQIMEVMDRWYVEARRDGLTSPEDDEPKAKGKAKAPAKKKKAAAPVVAELADDDAPVDAEA